MKKQKIVIINGLLILLIVCLWPFISSSNKIKATSKEEVVQTENTNESLVSPKSVPQSNQRILSNDEIPGIPLEGLFQIPSGAKSKISDNKVIVTEKLKNQIGSIFSTDEIKLDLTKKFTAEMFIKIDGDADGATFAMHNDPSAIAKFDKFTGSSLGVYPSYVNNYGNGNYYLHKSLKKSFAIEFDTYAKSGDQYDWFIKRNEDRGHVAYTFPDNPKEYGKTVTGDIMGITHHSLQYPTFKLGDNVWRKFTISWTPFDAAGNGQMEYYLEGLDPVKAVIPRSTFDVDSVYWGFTGSTGAEFEEVLVSFASVPGLIYYNDTLSLLNSLGDLVSEDGVVSGNSELTIHYSGEYDGGIRDLLNPVLTFDLMDGQVYQEGSFSVNGQSVTPNISGNSLKVDLANFSEENKAVDVHFKIKNEGFKTLDKAKITSHFSGSNYIQVAGSSVSYTIDAAPPTGTGKLTVINQGNPEKIISTSDYKSFLSALSDDYSPLENISVSLKPDQDIESKVKKLGPANFELIAKDEVGNEAVIKVPIFIKGEKEQIVMDDTFLLKGNSFSMKKKDYPETEKELKNYILNKAVVELWKFDAFGNYEKLDADMISIDMTQIPKPGIIPESKIYALTVAMSNGTLKIDLTMEINDASIAISFLNEAGEPLHELVELLGNVGEIRDLTKEATVQKIIQEIKQKHYELVESPDEESEIPIEIDGISVSYTFAGKLFIESFPSSLNFGDKYLTRSFIKEEQPEYDVPLIIGDTRNSKTPWTLTATLEQPLTSEENPSEVLSRAIWYKMNDATKVPLSQGEAQPIEVGTVLGADEYNVSQSWNANNTGVQLNVFSNEINQKGKYKAAILWQIAATP